MLSPAEKVRKPHIHKKKDVQDMTLNNIWTQALESEEYYFIAINHRFILNWSGIKC